MGIDQQRDLFLGAGVQPFDTETAPDQMRLFALGEIQQPHDKVVEPFNGNVHAVLLLHLQYQ